MKSLQVIVAMVSAFLPLCISFGQAQLNFGQETLIMPKVHGPYDAQIADFDGDNDLDIVVGTLYGQKLVWYENDGLGNYSDDHIIISLSQDIIRSIGVADFDGDGTIDVAAASQGDNKICVYFNNGAGLFSPLVIVSNTFNGATCITANDLDNDGDTDIAVTSWLDNKVVWFANNGTGNFGVEQNISTNIQKPSKITAIDINNDYYLDLVVVSSSTDSIFLVANMNDNTFSDKIFLGQAVDIADICIGDINNDGTLDILALSNESQYSSTVVIFKRNITAGLSFTAQLVPVFSTYLRSIEIADINDDSWPDIVYAGNDRVAWLENTLGNNFGPEVAFTTIPSDHHTLKLGDFDDDTDIDVMYLSNYDGAVSWIENYGSGSFSSPNFVDGLPYFLAHTVQVHDIDGDGVKDVISANLGSLAWYKNDETSDFGKANPILMLKGTYFFAVGDVDADADNDVISTSLQDSAILWSENLGAGDFAEPQVIVETGFLPRQVTLADINEDGYEDVVFSTYTIDAGGSIAFCLNNGNGTFADPQVIDDQLLGARMVSCADFNNDGFKDVIIGSHYSIGTINYASIVWYPNNGDATFGLQQIIYQFPTTVSSYLLELHLKDMDNDGNIDIIANVNADPLWFRNNGDGTFDAPATISIDITVPIKCIFIEDIDQNGTNDMFIGSFDRLLFMSNLGNVTFSIPIEIATSSYINLRNLYVADVDDDNDLDLFVANGNKLSWFQNTGLAIQAYINNAPCADAANGSISIFVTALQNSPYTYQWSKNGGQESGMGTASTDNFIIDNLMAGSYEITVTNASGSSATTTLNLSTAQGSLFEAYSITSINSSNLLPNGSIDIGVSGGQPPYTYVWNGLSEGSEISNNTNFTIPNLFAGVYNITITDANAEFLHYTISLLDETVPSNTCSSPLDIVILNDVSGSVDVIEYGEAKQFFVDLLNALNIGVADSQSRAAIVEWSVSDSIQVRIPITGNINNLQNYVTYNRLFEGGTNPNAALTYGYNYLSGQLRPFATPVLILSTDASTSQISNSLIVLANVYKAMGYIIITIAFDDAYSFEYTRNILTQTATLPLLAPGAPAYSLLNSDLANHIANIYICPSDPGSSNSFFFNRDGVFEIDTITLNGNCPAINSVNLTYTVTAQQQLALPAGMPITFYYNNPALFGANPILTTFLPCAIPAGTSEIFTITLPVTGPSQIWGVLNDDGSFNPPISFPLTDIPELIYSNNLDTISVCINPLPVLSAFKYTLTPQPVCGNTVFYTVDVCNIGTVDAYQVSVGDFPPNGFVLLNQNVNLNGCSQINTNNVSYDIPVGCCVSITYEYNVSNAANGTYNNQGAMLWGSPEQTYINFDGNSTSDEDVTIDGTIDCPSDVVTFTKTVNTTQICKDGFLTYTFTIHNQTNLPLQGLQFTDPLPYPAIWATEPYILNGLSIGLTNITGTQNASFTIAEIQPNTVATFSLDAYLGNGFSYGSILNTAELSGLPTFVNGNGYSLIAQSSGVTILETPLFSVPNIIQTSYCQYPQLTATIANGYNPQWLSTGDGIFTNPNSLQTTYIPGPNDLQQGSVALSLSAQNECGNYNTYIQLQINQPPDCNDNDCNTDDFLNPNTCECENLTITPQDCNDNNPLTTDVYNPDTCLCEHTFPEQILLLPNAFSPNQDGINDLFRATYNQPVTSFYLVVYNRWGQRVFETSDIHQGWNGMFNGQPAPMGVYVWYAIYRFPSQTTDSFLSGNVTLIR